jgi:acetyl-CoA acetyltransferase
MYADAGARNEVELIMPVASQARDQAGLSMQEIDFTCSGSCDYLQGKSFAFVEGVDAPGAVPPIAESHVEMDAAWALYEAWLKILSGEADTALIYGFSRSSAGPLPDIMTLQTDPYYSVPLWMDAISAAALQANTAIEAGELNERQMAEVVSRSRRNAKQHPHPRLSGDYDVDDLLREPEYVAPLRRHDCAPITDGASAMVIAERSTAEKLCERPAVIRGIDHRIESVHLGMRDLSTSVSTRIAAAQLEIDSDKIDIAELYAPFSHQEIILSKALSLKENTQINLSGGVLAGNIMMAAGLDRVGFCAQHIASGKADRALAHATSGSCLQQNLLVLMEGN